jgi:predicted O-methyltransferase YrrM
MTRLPFRNSFDYLRAATFFDALTPSSKDALLEIVLDDDFQGATDPPTLGLLYALLANNSFTSVLQLGTWMGFSTIVFADALKRSAAIHKNSPTLDTVECNVTVHRRARNFIERAQHQDIVRCHDGDSTDPELIKQLLPQYDFIYVDSSHTYEGTAREIELYYPRLKSEGLMAFHDSSRHAVAWDPSKKGGVRKALDEWINSPNGPNEKFFLGRPFWSSDCGLFVAKKS